MAIDFYIVLLLLLVVVTSMMFAIFFLYAHSIMPGLRRVDDQTFVKSFQAIDKAIINPAFMAQFFLPLFLFLGLYLYALSDDRSEATYLLFGFIAYLIVFLLTVIVNVPRNDAIKRIPADAGLEIMRRARVDFNESRWTASNIARTIGNAIAVLFAVAALGVYLI